MSALLRVHVMITNQIEPFLLQFIHNNLKDLVRYRSRLFLLPFSIDRVEPFLIYFISSLLPIVNSKTHPAHPYHIPLEQPAPTR
jgi:hypothetical protein